MTRRRRCNHEEELARLGEALVALDRLVDAKFVTFKMMVESQADKVALALAASDKAVTKAEAATDKRFDGVNEFRSQLSDQASRFVTRDTFDARVTSIDHAKDAAHAGLTARLDAVEKMQERQAGRAGGLYAGWGYLVTAAGLALTVMTLVIIFTR